ncbi:hypothetical protein ABPH35_05735 [Streptococcus sp. ZJ93]|uniref:hypothetical protein n=1 Tax=Streptococcus handemini TaxID=3161188 RepID=UPI0032EF2FC8
MDNLQKICKKRPAVRLAQETHEKLVEFCAENDLVISTTLGRFVEFCLENVEFREVHAPVEKLFIGDSEV